MSRLDRGGKVRATRRDETRRGCIGLTSSTVRSKLSSDLIFFKRNCGRGVSDKIEDGSFCASVGSPQNHPVPILSPPIPHLSRPQQAEVVVAVLQDKSRWLARRRVPFRLEGRPRAPDLGPERPIPRARSVHDKMAFVLSLYLSLYLSPVLPISPTRVWCARRARLGEKRA